MKGFLAPLTVTLGLLYFAVGENVTVTFRISALNQNAANVLAYKILSPDLVAGYKIIKLNLLQGKAFAKKTNPKASPLQQDKILPPTRPQPLRQRVM